MRLPHDVSGEARLPLIAVQLIWFVGVGSVATFLHVATAFLANVLGAPPLVANTVGFLCSVTTSYLGNFYWTFSGAAAHRQSLGRFAIMSALAFVVTTAIAYIVQTALGWPFVAALALMLAVVPPLNFMLGRLWVFRRQS